MRKLVTDETMDLVLLQRPGTSSSALNAVACSGEGRKPYRKNTKDVVQIFARAANDRAAASAAADE